MLLHNKPTHQFTRILLATTFFTFLISAILIIASCSWLGFSSTTGDSWFLYAGLEAIASNEELRAFKRADRKGNEELSLFLEEFWKRRDPIPSTKQNEYRERFEARLASFKELPVFFSDAAKEAKRFQRDERRFAFLLYGNPTRKESRRVSDSLLQVVWIYEPDSRIKEAGKAYPLLEELTYSITYDSPGISLQNSVVWEKLLPALSDSALKALGNLLQDIRQDKFIRAAAAWRLRADPSPKALSVLLLSADTDDELVNSVISDGLSPLKLVRTERGILEHASRGIREPSRVTLAGEIIGRPEEVVPYDVADSEDLMMKITSVYSPASYLPSAFVDSLRAKASISNQYLHSKGWLTPEEAKELYAGPLAEARSLLDQSLPDKAHELLDPLIKGGTLNSAEAFYLDALALAEMGSPGSRQLSEQRIRESLRKDPGNLRYRLALGQILSARTLDLYAENTADRILDEAPGLGDAYALKGRIRIEAYWGLGWRAGGWGRMGDPLNPEPLHEEALILLNQALVCDSNNETAAWFIGLDKILAREWWDAVQVMSFLIREDVHIAEAKLGRALAFQHLGLLDLAWDDYQSALQLLPLEARMFIGDPRWTQTPSSGGITRGSVTAVVEASEVLAEEKDSYWRAKDPLFSTELNERLLEQYRRFAYVTWRFAAPNVGLRGWETIRGKVYLRYGEPLTAWSRASRAGRIWIPGLVTAEDNKPIRDITGRDTGGVIPLLGSERWQYENMTVYFGGGWVTGNLTFWPSDTEDWPGMYVIDSMADFERIAEIVPDHEAVVGSRDILALETLWYLFETDFGESELIPVLLLPTELRNAIIRRDIVEDIPLHQHLLDSSWNIISSHQSILDISLVTRTLRLPIASLMIILPSLITEEIPSYAAIELLPVEGGAALASRDTVAVDLGYGLKLSSLVLAEEVIGIDELMNSQRGFYLTRDDFAIKPYTSDEYDPEKPLELYFEIYGLELDEVGGTDYQITLEITNRERRGVLSALVSTLGQFVGRTLTEGRVSLTYDRSGITKRTQEHFGIVVQDERDATGYEITVRVLDRISGNQSERTLFLSVLR